MTAVLTTDEVVLHHGDCIDVMRAMPDASVDAIVTDPPYGLSELAPRAFAEVLAAWLAGDRAAAPKGSGFMGKSWDAFVPPPAVWDEAYRVLKPGGHLLAFAGSRTDDLMGLAIRLAGFEIRDGIAWLYGSGFPKSMDVAQAIDKLDAADERLARAREFQAWLRHHLTPQQVNALTGTDMGHHFTTHPSQPSIATSDLFDLLRPALPPVPERIEQLVADRTVESVNFAARAVVGQHRTAVRRGSAGVTAGGTGKARTVSATDEARQWEGWGTALKPAFEPIVVARKPFAGTVAANVLAHGTGALNIDASRVGHGDDVVTFDRDAGARSRENYRTGTVIGAAKPSGRGRFPSNVVLDDVAAEELDGQSGILTSGMMRAGTARAPRDGAVYGRLEGDATPRDTFGDSGGASRFFYTAKADSTERPVVDGIAHPTVKPLDLMRWLVRLVTPRGGVVLEPFAGSGTTLEAAVLEGFRAIGIEREADYIPLIQKRLDKPHAVGLDIFGGAA